MPLLPVPWHFCHADAICRKCSSSIEILILDGENIHNLSERDTLTARWQGGCEYTTCKPRGNYAVALRAMRTCMGSSTRRYQDHRR